MAYRIGGLIVLSFLVVASATSLRATPVASAVCCSDGGDCGGNGKCCDGGPLGLDPCSLERPAWCMTLCVVGGRSSQ